MTSSSDKRDRRLAPLEEQGFVILEGLLSAPELEEVRLALAPYLAGGPNGRNNFEGVATPRVHPLGRRAARAHQSV